MDLVIFNFKINTFDSIALESQSTVSLKLPKINLNEYKNSLNNEFMKQRSIG